MASGRRSAGHNVLPHAVRDEVVRALDPEKTDGDAAAALDHITLPDDFRVHAAIFLLRRDPYLRIERLPSEIGSLVPVKGLVGAALYELRWSEPSIRGTSAFFRLRTQPDSAMAVLIAVTTGPAWRQGFQKLFGWLYPTAFPPFLRQPDLRSIFENMQRFLRDPLRIRLTRVSSLRRLLHTPSRRRYESELTWTDRDAEEAFADAAEALTYFRSVSFEVCELESKGRVTRVVSKEVRGRVSRDAQFSANTHFKWLFATSVEPALERTRKGHEMARDRSRLSVLGPAPRAIAARFDAVQLQRQDMPRIAERLRRMPGASVSILHGNPYLNATIVDMNDGSTFDLLVASEKYLVIVPQLRATEAAVTRICRYVYDQVGEAEFVDASNEFAHPH